MTLNVNGLYSLLKIQRLYKIDLEKHNYKLNKRDTP